MQLSSYLTFTGQCHEALQFYQACLHVQIEVKETYANATFDVPDTWQEKILHVE